MLLGHHGLPQLLLPCLGWLSRLGHADQALPPAPPSQALTRSCPCMALAPKSSPWPCCHATRSPAKAHLQSCLLEPEAAWASWLPAPSFAAAAAASPPASHSWRALPSNSRVSLGRHHRVEVGVEAAQMELGASPRAVPGDVALLRRHVPLKAWELLGHIPPGQHLHPVPSLGCKSTILKALWFCSTARRLLLEHESC